MATRWMAPAGRRPLSSFPESSLRGGTQDALAPAATGWVHMACWLPGKLVRLGAPGFTGVTLAWQIPKFSPPKRKRGASRKPVVYTKRPGTGSTVTCSGNVTTPPKSKFACSSQGHTS